MGPELAAALRRIPLFNALPPTLLDEVGRLCGVRRVRKGELLFSEGDPADFLPVLLSGQVKLARTGPDGREQLLHLVRGPASFAEAAVFGPGVFPATTTVVEGGVLATVSRPALLDLLRHRPEVALALLASMSLWLRRLADLVEGLALHTVEERVAAYLWSAFARSAGTPLPGAEIRLQEPKRLIAALCGTAPEVLSRTFRRLADEGVVRVHGPLARLVDPNALAKLAGVGQETLG
ncbi:MAG: Crp/Fnr family transcriptional regulator [Acidobacteriia bacterium]|nr:Crp/Fnr family transcriptional regulator [Terriglobia bacterium]